MQGPMYVLYAHIETHFLTYTEREAHRRLEKTHTHRHTHTSELSCVEWGHFEVLINVLPPSPPLSAPCGVSAMATNIRHTLTKTPRPTDTHADPFHLWSSHTYSCISIGREKERDKGEVLKKCLKTKWHLQTTHTRLTALSLILCFNL